MKPEKLFWLRSSEVKNVRFPKWGAIVPTRLWPERFRAMTLWLVLQDMPAQLQTKAFEDQFVKTLFGSLLMWDLKARSADSSTLWLRHNVTQFVTKATKNSREIFAMTRMNLLTETQYNFFAVFGLFIITFRWSCDKEGQASRPVKTHAHPTYPVERKHMLVKSKFRVVICPLYCFLSKKWNI